MNEVGDVYLFKIREKALIISLYRKTKAASLDACSYVTLKIHLNHSVQGFFLKSKDMTIPCTNHILLPNQNPNIDPLKQARSAFHIVQLISKSPLIIL